MLKLPNRSVLGISAIVAALIAGASIAASDKIVKIDGSATVIPHHGSRRQGEIFRKPREVRSGSRSEFLARVEGSKVLPGGNLILWMTSRPILEKEMADCKAAGVQYNRNAGGI